MDEGDDYVPQMSQMADYSMGPMGAPQPVPQQQRYAQPVMPINPYEQQQQQHQQMIMMQQQHMHMAGQQQQQQQQQAPAQAPPAKKPRGKSKKAQAAEAAAAAAAAAAANQMDPMASMAAMSNNPMMRQNAYPNQMPMYGGAHYQGASGPAQQGYRPGPAAGAQAQYPPQNYQQMYHQRPPQTQQPQAQPGYPYGYPPQSSTGYPPPQQAQYPPQGAPPPHMRHQYPPQGQQAPPGYWEGYPGYGAAAVPQQASAVPPVTSQPMNMASQQDQWGRGGQNEILSIIQQLEKTAAEVKTRINQLYIMPRNPQADAEVQQLQHKLGVIQNDLYRYNQQLQHSYQVAATHHAPQVPPTSQPAAGPPSQHHGMTPNPGGPPPVHVNQSGNQVQLNITAADKSRTLISVYHEGYTGSGASSTESKESIVPPEPTPSIQQQPPPTSSHESVQQQQAAQQQPNSQPQTPQVKLEEKAAPYQQSSYNGVENGVTTGNPYAQQQQMFGQYPNQPQSSQQQHQSMVGYPHHQQPQQQMHQQQPPAYGMGANSSSAPPPEIQLPQQMQTEPQVPPEQPQQSAYPGYPDYAAATSSYPLKSLHEEPAAVAAEPSSQPSPAIADPLVSSSSQQNEQPQVPDQSEASSSNSHEQFQQQQSDVVESMPQTAELIQQQEERNPEIEPQISEQPLAEPSIEDTIVKEEPHEAQISDNGAQNNGDMGEMLEYDNQLEVAQEEEVESENDITMENGVDEGAESSLPTKEEVFASEQIDNHLKEEADEPMEEDDDEKDEDYVQDEKEEDEDDEERDLKPAMSEEPDEELEGESVKSLRAETKEEEDDDMSSMATKDDFKDMSEEPAASETNDGFTEPSTPATPMMVTPSTKKKSYRRPAVVVSKSKKKKSVDDSDDDDFYPQRGKGRKKGGSSRKKAEIIGDDTMEGEKSGGSDDDEFLVKVEAPIADPNALVVEKILNLRMHKVEVGEVKMEGEDDGEEKAVKVEGTEAEAAPENTEKKVEEVEQFLIKWKNRSYVHCEWKSAAELLEIDKRVDGKIKRFRAKKLMSYNEDDEDFNSDYVIVDRVVDLITEDDGQEFALIKWKSLGYEEVTWEPVEAIPADKLEVWRNRQLIDTAKIKEKARPEADEWKKLSQAKVWKNGNSLREYQFEGVDWLLYCYYNAQNCILADEMGLGKTVQTITFLSQVFDYGVHGPFLIVVPLSTIHNWVREFETWTDMNAVVYHGSAHAREVLQQYEIFYDKRHSGAKNWRKNFVKLDALITTFETVVSDVEFLKKIPWRVCVIDEAHRLKNRNCKLLVNGLLAFRMEHRVLLTGTPLQNNIEELFSLLNFLHPQQFNNSATFLEQFGSCQTDDQVQKLQEILRPMMLRRLKEDVEKSLGPKEETIIEVQLSDMQKKFYRAILERNFSHLCKGTSAPSLMNVMMELRKCCNHPFLINGAEETIMNDFRAAHPDWDDETLTHRALVQASGKVVLIEKLLPKLRKDGHKVLIFSQMVKVLDLLEEFLISMSYPFERIDGNVRGDLRQASIDRFSRENSDRFVFLLCTRAGGLGINLTAADTVIIFDSDWNPQNDLQAQARCHRIGQKKLVKVYRLITSNTYEREMFDKASLKLGLDKAVLQSTTALKAEGTALSKKDVEELLKKGAYGSIMDEENESAKFNEEDIETILQRRTQTITLEAGQKGSLFAKASFNSTHNKGDDIDLDDPEFWTKWAEKAQVDVEKATATPDGRELILEEPRKRTKRFEDNKIDEEDSDGSEGSGKRKRGAPGANRKRRKDDDDTDYSASYRPDELATSKAEYFKVEKVLAQYGWGRWSEIKKYGELELAEVDIEHMSRTLLLHCVREFRGDDRVRKFVFNLIKPQGITPDKEIKTVGPISAFHQGWAAMPEFNPPSFALDSAFQRHVHRHANKLMTKIDMLKHLEMHIIGDEKSLVEDPSVKWTEIKLKEMPTAAETVTDGWDADCDKCFLIGCWRHGLENYDAIRADETLCFNEKNIANFPNAGDCWTRFRRLLVNSQKSVHDPVYEKLNWTKREQQEFMRVLRSFGIKESKPGPGVDWNLFRAFSTHLEKKIDEECHEQLMCVLAMCNRAQGSTDLKPLDGKRAMVVEPMSAIRAAKMLNRLHLMRKVHTLADHLASCDMSLCEMNGMPSGWSIQHDKELIEICDQYGLESLAANVLNKPAFTKIVRPSETTLLRRVIEIVSTIEAGKWCGVGDVESVNDSEVDEKKDMAAIAAAQAQFLRLQQQQQQAAATAAARKGGRKRPNNEQEVNKRAMQQLSQMLGAAMGGSQAGSNDYANTLLTMMLMQQLIPGSSSNVSNSQLQQVAQMLAVLLSTTAQQQQSAASTSTPSTSTSSKSAANANASQAAAIALAQVAAASNDAAQQDAILQTLLAMSMNPAALAAMSAQASTSGVSSAAQTPAKKVVKAAPKEATPVQTVSASSVLAAQNAARAEASKNEETDILKTLEKAGVDYVALNHLNLLSKDARLPMINKHTKETLPEARRPQVRDLTSFVKASSDWILDTAALTEMVTATVSKTGSPSARPSAAATPVATPKPPVANVETKPPPVSTPTPVASATVNIKVGASLQLDDMVSVFNRKTGELLAAAKWPKAKELSTWLDANPDYNVHSNSAAIAQLSLGNAHGDRIGGDAFAVASSSSAIPSNAHTPAPPLTPSTPVSATAAATAAANAQLFALAAAQQQQQQQAAAVAAAAAAATGTATSSKSRAAAQAASAAAQAASQQEALNKHQLELLQMQMLMQQYQQTAALQAMIYGYGMPTTSAASSTANATSIAALAAAQAAQQQAASTSSTSKQTLSASTPSTSSSAALGEDINPLLLSAIMQNPAVLQSMMMDPNSMAALFAAQSHSQQPAPKKAKHP